MKRSILLAVLFAATSAIAQYPSRTVKIVVTIPPGGAPDIAARIIGQKMSENIGQPVVIENRPGANGNTAAHEVARAAPDGYTLMVGYVATHGTNPAVRKVPYDAVKDFTPISHVVSQPLLVVVHPAVPVKSMAELVAYAKAQKAPLQYTTGGIGSYGHLWWEMVRARQGIDGQHIAYNGITPALKDVMGGQVPLLIDAIVPTGAQVKGGTVRGIAIVASQRAKSLPDLATLSEQGYAGLDAAPFYGVLGPAGMDAAVVQKLSSTLMRALATPALRDKLQELGFDVVASTPDVYTKLIRDEIDRWSAVVKQSGIKVE